MQLKRIFLTLIFIGGAITFSFAQAPEVEWIKSYGDLNNDFGYDLYQTSDDGYIIAGSRWYTGHDFPEPYIMKVNDEGDSLWATSFPGLGVDEAIFCAPTADNGYIVVGNKRIFEVSESDIFAAKLDSLGTVIWEHTYGDSGVDIANNCLVTSDGGLIISGYTQMEDLLNFDIYLFRINSDGDTLWTSKYGNNHFDMGYSIVPAYPDGYLLLTGISRPLGGSRPTIFSIDEYGHSSWSRSYSESYGTCISMIGLEDGSYVILTNAEIVDDLYRIKFVINLMKIRDDGEILWVKTIQTENDLYARSIKQMPDNGFVICGSAGDTNDTDQFIIRTNSVGDTLWTARIEGIAVSSDYANSIIITSDGGYAFTGELSSDQAMAQLSIIKLADDQVGITAPNEQVIPQDISLQQNYPNPFNGSTLISYELPTQSEVTISIYDILGREIDILQDGIKPAGHNQIVWQADGISSGMYFYKIQAGDYSESKKMILMK